MSEQGTYIHEFKILDRNQFSRTLIRRMFHSEAVGRNWAERQVSLIEQLFRAQGETLLDIVIEHTHVDLDRTTIVGGFRRI